MAAAIPAAIGAVVGQDQNRRARNQQQEGINMQRDVLAKQEAWRKFLMDMVTKSDQSGEFNPEQRIGRLNDISFANQGRAQDASAGASRILGYRPGDSTPLTAQRGISESYDLNRRAQNNDIYNNSFARRLGAYESIGAPGSEGLQVGQSISQNGASQQQDLSGLISSFLNSRTMQPRQRMQQPTQGANPQWNMQAIPGYAGHQRGTPWTLPVRR